MRPAPRTGACSGTAWGGAARLPGGSWRHFVFRVACPARVSGLRQQKGVRVFFAVCTPTLSGGADSEPYMLARLVGGCASGGEMILTLRGAALDRRPEHTPVKHTPRIMF